MKTINIKYPLYDDNNSNRLFLMNVISRDSYSSNLLLYLLTQKGEKYYDSNFGSNLLKFVFEPNDDLTSSDIEEELKREVPLYVKNVKINSVSFNRLVDDDGNEISENQLNFNVKFTYSEGAINEDGDLNIKF